MIHNSVLWQVARPAPDDFVQKFPEYSRLISQLLFNRGLDTQEKIDEFFDADYSAHMHDPYLFRDMEKAVERILRAIEKKEKIVIYGDFRSEKIDEFFDADYSAHMHDPYLFRDMEKAVERILRAIEKKEKIVIYGDY